MENKPRFLQLIPDLDFEDVLELYFDDAHYEKGELAARVDPEGIHSHDLIFAIWNFVHVGIVAVYKVSENPHQAVPIYSSTFQIEKEGPRNARFEIGMIMHELEQQLGLKFGLLPHMKLFQHLARFMEMTFRRLMLQDHDPLKQKADIYFENLDKLLAAGALKFFANLPIDKNDRLFRVLQPQLLQQFQEFQEFRPQPNQPNLHVACSETETVSDQYIEISLTNRSLEPSELQDLFLTLQMILRQYSGVPIFKDNKVLFPTCQGREQATFRALLSDDLLACVLKLYDQNLEVELKGGHAVKSNVIPFPKIYRPSNLN